jgi:GNAT superfamily N-acetyltransferase
MNIDARRGDFAISTERSLLDLDSIHAYLSRSYWSPNLPRSVMEKGFEHSICFGVYRASEQVGFARVITDRATFAYLADVFILPAFQGRGLGKWLMEIVLGHRDLQGLRRFLLATRDAHDLYRRFGFTPIDEPSRLMQIHKPDPYASFALPAS